MDNIKNKKRCDKCIGTGFVKSIPIKCIICKGITCEKCNYTGCQCMPPYELCDKCDSSGEI